jgi:two-component system nitrogen regulation sensor histidine kinase NtrY
VNLDREQIKRVLINLLDNAVAAIDGAEGLVEIVTGHDPALQVARLEVADNGVGIRPEDRGRLFEPYFSTKRTGTGLGLAIVSKIVADHNGYIRVRDNEPRGTRFVIELPL